MKRFLGLLAALLFAVASPAFANPIPAINTPLDTPQALVNTAIVNLNAVTPAYQYASSCSGTTTATCQGIRVVVSITGLTTAAGVTSATMTVTDASVVAASQVNCFTANYGGTGNPVPVLVVAGAGSFTVAVENIHASAALNATVPIACFVYN
jgi:hypothetical protein